MKTTWQHSPGSRQHWLHKGHSYGGKILGMVYEVNPTAFTVYRDSPPTGWANREFIAEMPTLDEAKGLLQTLVGAQL